MITRLFFLLLLCQPTITFAQSSRSDPKAAKIIEKECNDGVFTVVEELPSLAIAKESFEDTLATALRASQFPMVKDKIVYRFLVTKQAQILDLTVDSGRVSEQKTLEETIFRYAALWTPAKQSGRPVCAYVRLKIKFTNDKLTVDIRQ